MIFKRRDIKIVRSEANKLDSIIRRYNDSQGPTVIQAYQDGLIDEDQLIELVEVLETNGYPRKQLYDLPYSFAVRILL